MKTTNLSDTLDHKIDELLAGQPGKPSTKFTERVLAAADELAVKKATPHSGSQWLRLALPIAAIITLVLLLTQMIPAPSVETDSPELTTGELHEIFMLEEGLMGLTGLEGEDLIDANLLNLMDILNSEIQS